MTNQKINKAIAKKLGRSPLRPVRPYCTDIGCAWDIVEDKAVLVDWWCFTVHAYLGGFVAGWSDRNDDWLHKTHADTAPMAICLAFLKLAREK